MTKEEYQNFALRYKGCGVCFPLFEKLNRFEKMQFTAIQKDVAELEEKNAKLKSQIEKMKYCANCDFVFKDGNCYYDKECKNKDHWKLRR